MLGGKSCRLVMSFGAQEEIAEHEPYFQVLYAMLAGGLASTKDVDAVLRAGLKWAGDGIELSDVIEDLGRERCRELAAQAVGAAYRMPESWLKNSAAATLTARGVRPMIGFGSMDGSSSGG